MEKSEQNDFDLAREGYYAKKQIFCRDRLISWSHRKRFELALLLAEEFAGDRVLDYGCGDGTFLSSLMTCSVTPAEAVGAELSADVVDECRNRLNHLRGLSFVSIKELDDPRHKCAYDGVVCMEVLEHVVDLNSVLDTIAGLLVSGGRLLISVPVETGIPFMFKQAVRTIAGWRGIGDYPGITSYTWREYWATVFASSGQHIERPIYQTGDGLGFHDHKGFNWMAFRKSLDRRFKMQRMWASPLTRLPPHLASQVWFLLRVRS